MQSVKRKGRISNSDCWILLFGLAKLHSPTIPIRSENFAFFILNYSLIILLFMRNRPTPPNNFLYENLAFSITH